MKHDVDISGFSIDSAEHFPRNRSVLLLQCFLPYSIGVHTWKVRRCWSLVLMHLAFLGTCGQVFEEASLHGVLVGLWGERICSAKGLSDRWKRANIELRLLTKIDNENQLVLPLIVCGFLRDKFSWWVYPSRTAKKIDFTGSPAHKQGTLVSPQSHDPDDPV